jgi:hypothetical protein
MRLADGNSRERSAPTPDGTTCDDELRRLDSMLGSLSRLVVVTTSGVAVVATIALLVWLLLRG